jgi:hypothetical protein
VERRREFWESDLRTVGYVEPDRVDIAAEKATELPRLGKPRMKLNVHESQTSMKAKKSSVLPI